MNMLNDRPSPNKPLHQRASTRLFAALSGIAILTGCDNAPVDPINREAITALQIQALSSLPADCRYVYTLGDGGFSLNTSQLDKKGLGEAAQELTAQNNILVVPPALMGGEQTSLSELQKDVIMTSSLAIARSTAPPFGPTYLEVAVCPSSEVLSDQVAHVIVTSPLVPTATRS